MTDTGYFTFDDKEIPRGGTDADWDRFRESAHILMSGVPTEYLEVYFQLLTDELGEIQMDIERERDAAEQQ